VWKSILTDHKESPASIGPKDAGSALPDPLGAGLAMSDSVGRGSTLFDPKSMGSVLLDPLDRIPPRSTQGF
jgi:hypothetical protein